MSLLGLIPTHQTRSNTTDEYYLRKGQPITTPLNIASANGTHTATLGVSNGGTLTISTDADASPFNDIVLEPAGSLYLQPQSVNGFVQVGEGTEVGGAFLNVGGSEGPSRVYDELYNTPPTTTTPGDIIFTTGNSFTTSNGFFAGSASAPGVGLYMLNCEVKLTNSGSFSIPTGSLMFYMATANGTGSLMFSEIDITNTMLISPASGTANEPSFTSGAFRITDSATYTVAFEINGTWNLGTDSSINFQLVKLA